MVYSVEISSIAYLSFNCTWVHANFFCFSLSFCMCLNQFSVAWLEHKNMFKRPNNVTKSTFTTTGRRPRSLKPSVSVIGVVESDRCPRACRFLRNCVENTNALSDCSLHANGKYTIIAMSAASRLPIVVRDSKHSKTEFVTYNPRAFEQAFYGRCAGNGCCIR